MSKERVLKAKKQLNNQPSDQNNELFIKDEHCSTLFTFHDFTSLINRSGLQFFFKKKTLSLLRDDYEVN